MSCNETMNVSLRAKLLKANEEYGIFEDAQLRGKCWAYHTGVITGKTRTRTATGSKSHKLWLEYYRSLPLTPDELCYIHENLAPEAWAKLGLKLPEKKLEYTIPRRQITDLNILAWLKASVEAGKCVRAGFCVSCRSWRGLTDLDDVSDCNGHSSCAPLNPEFLEMFKAILDAQLPPLKYNVPALNEKERKHVGYLTKCLVGHCSHLDDISFCNRRCLSIFTRVFDDQNLQCLPVGPSSPERAQIIDALKRVLKQQEPLLPPHNLDPLPQPKWDVLKEWQRHGSVGCPASRGEWRRSDCCDTFPSLPKQSIGRTSCSGNSDDCPCHFYTRKAVNAVVDLKLAVGPEFEEFSVWDAKGNEIKIVSQSGFCLYIERDAWIHEADVGEGKPYTKTPPPPEEKFQPYVAVTIRGNVVYIIDEMSSGLSFQSSAGGIYHKDDLIRITNPDEAYRMLGEVLGKKDVVEEIKTYCEERKAYFTRNTTNFSNGMVAASGDVLTFIANREREAKCHK